MEKLIILGVVLAILGLCTCFPNSEPPAEFCDSMNPGYNVPPQQGPSPFRLTPSKRNVFTDESVDLTLKGPLTFKEFIIQVRDSRGNPSGFFNIKPEDPLAKRIDCKGNTGNVAINKDSSPKTSVTLNWIPPFETGTYTIWFTTVRERDSYWVKQYGGSLTLQVRRTIKN